MELLDSYNSWDEFVNSYFFDTSRFKVTYYDYDKIRATKIFVLSKNIYIQFEFDKENVQEFVKLEFGSNDDRVLCKGVFNSTCKSNLEFRQHSWLEEAGTSFRAICNKYNLVKVIDLLKIPLEYGWTEKQYHFKNAIYKVLIQLHVSSELLEYEVITRSFEEQDIPSLFDKPFRLLNKMIVESIFYKSKIVLKEIKIG